MPSRRRTVTDRCHSLRRCGQKVAGHLVRLISRGKPSNAGSVSSPWFFALPPNERTMAAVFWIQSKFALTIASQLENLPASAKQVGRFERFCKKKVVLLTAGSASVRRRDGHAAIAKRLPLGEHVVIEESNQWIMQSHSKLIIRAIQSVVEEADKRPNEALAGKTRV